jgi:Rrf2 family transcriptional regulator, nitric oxide-sensitive transcriptional repressor
LRLTTHTDYALRTLMYLNARSGRATISQVAELFSISVHHVAKVVNALARQGYIRSVRGIGGGIELAKLPEDIRLGDVIQAVEGNLHLLECIETDQICAIQSFCKLKGALAEAERVQFSFLNGITLSDVSPTRHQLRQVKKAVAKSSLA